MKGSNNFSITNKTRRRLPSVPFSKIKNAVLGQKYELSLVFIGSALSKKLNNTYRGKDKPANVLSFLLSKTQGEIFIDLIQKEFHPGFLFIHALLHLKGMSHGSRMERREMQLFRKFKIFHGSTIRNRH